jgi:hypothetical protein
MLSNLSRNAVKQFEKQQKKEKEKFMFLNKYFYIKLPALSNKQKSSV